MKRNHVYLGGTLLLVVLGAVGAYYVFAGGGELKDPAQADTDISSDQTDDTLAIEVPPIEDDAQNVPEMTPGFERSPRYAMGGSPLDSHGPYPPAAGGASPLPALPAVPDPIEKPSTGNVSSGGMTGAAGGFDEIPDEKDATARAYETPGSGGQHYGDLVSREQEPYGLDATAIDAANSLRGGARAAFESDPAGEIEGEDEIGAYAQPTDQTAGRYAGSAARGGSASSDEDLYPVRHQPSAPAPIAMAATNAVPLSQSTVVVDSEREVADGGELDALDAEELLPQHAEGGYGYSKSGGVGRSALPGGGAYNSEAYGSDDYGNDTFASGAPPGAAAAAGEGTGRPGEAALEGPQAPQLSIEKVAPVEIQVGKECTFEVIVRNVGRVTAHDVRLLDEIPLGTQLVQTTPRATAFGSRLEWELGNLPSGAEQTVQIRLLPTDEGEIGSVATVYFAAAASVRTHSTRPQLQLRTDMARSVMIGQQQVLKITLRNPGTGDATGVMLLENVPPGMSHPHGSALEFEVGTLRAGESRELELVLTADQKGFIQNRIVAKGDGNLLAEDISEFEVVAPEIAVSVAGPERKYLEMPATFTVAVENRGTAAATDVELVSKLPRGLEFVSADNFGQYDQQTHSVYWSLAALPPRERGEVKLVALPVDLGEQRLQVKAGADLGLVDQAESAVKVEGLAAIQFEVADTADPIEVGSGTSYEIRVVNQGSKAATNLIVVAHLPPGLEAVRAEGPTSKQMAADRVEFAPLAELSPKADTTYRIDVQGRQVGDQRIRVQIMTDDISQPITKEESTRVYADQ